MTGVLQLPAVMLVAHYSGASAKCKKNHTSRLMTVLSYLTFSFIMLKREN